MRYCNACGRGIAEHIDLQLTSKLSRRFCPIKRAPRLARHPRKGHRYTAPPRRYVFDPGAAA